VLVGSARHQDARATQALETREHVGGHGKADHVADVPRTVGVGPRGSNQDSSLFSHLVDSIGQALA